MFTMRVHTDHTKFPQLIQPGECIIAPLVELEHKKLSDDVNDREPLLYIIKIPHSLKHTAQYKFVRVRRGEDELPVRSEAGENFAYEIDEKFIIEVASLWFSTNQYYDNYFRFAQFICAVIWNMLI